MMLICRNAAEGSPVGFVLQFDQL